MEQRWEFLEPWCTALKPHVSYHSPRSDPNGRDVTIHRYFVVTIPPRDEFNGDESVFRAKLQQIREGLALLVAVKYVDSAAWRFLLVKYWGVDIGSEGERLFEEEIPARFDLTLNLEGRREEDDAVTDFDLVRFCGTYQREQASEEYVDMLGKIANLDAELKRGKAGVDIAIPFRVGYCTCRARYVGGAMKALEGIHQAETMIYHQWENYFRSSAEKELPHGSLRCTFVMEPMSADFSDFLITSEMTAVMEKLVGSNVWFSEILTLSAELDEKLEADAREAKKAVGQLVTSVFSSTRRCPEQARTKYYPELDTFKVEPNPLQLGTVNMNCNFAVSDGDVLAMCLAIAVSQTTKTLRMQVSLEQSDEDYNITYRGHLWKYLAYGLFSARSRAFSALESIELLDIDNMEIADIETFCAIVASKHPEEDMMGYSQGHGNERDAILTNNSPIRWQFNSDGQPPTDSRPIILDSPVQFVRSFNDDGESDWVDVLLPGYGRCQAQRKDLEFNRDNGDWPRGAILTSLRLRFDKVQPSVSTGLPLFLAAVGSSLTTLTLDGPRVDLDKSFLSQSCPNLVDLSLCGSIVQVHLNFSEYHDRKQPLPDLECDWGNISALAVALTEMSTPFARCVRRLQVCPTDRLGGWYHLDAGYNPNNFERDAQALLRVLDVNQSLECFDIVVRFENRGYIDAFRIHHRKPIDRPSKLDTKSKLAFLSATLSGETSLHGDLYRSTINQLDQHLIANIFTFAAPPVLRKVFFRSYADDSENYEDISDSDEYDSDEVSWDSYEDGDDAMWYE